MALIELPANRTVMTADDAAKYLAQAYRKVAGKGANYSILSLLVGQWASENANGNAMFNYNFGNTMPTGSTKYFHWLNASEIIDGVDTPMRERFAAYKSPIEGAEAFIKVLKSRAHWWNGLQSGNPQGFVDGLKTSPSYFTADKNAYLKLLISRMTAYTSSAKKYASTFWGTFGQVLLGTALATGGLYYTKKNQTWPFSK